MASFYPNLYQALLRLCVEARVNAGLSHAELAARFGTPESFAASYEDGRRLLDAAEFIAASRAIGVDPYELLKKADEAGGERA